MKRSDSRLRMGAYLLLIFCLPPAYLLLVSCLSPAYFLLTFCLPFAYLLLIFCLSPAYPTPAPPLKGAGSAYGLIVTFMTCSWEKAHIPQSPYQESII